MPAPIWRTSPARTISLCEIASASAGACFSVGSRYSDRRVIGRAERGGQRSELRVPTPSAASAPLIEQLSPTDLRRRPDKEPHGLLSSPASLRLRRARAAHRQGDDGVPPRQAPPGLRGQGQRRARGHRVGRQAGRGGAEEPRQPRREEGPRQKQRRRPLQPLAVLGEHERPTAAASPTASSRAAIDAAFGSFADFKAKLKETGVGQFGSGWSWLVHDGSGLAVVGSPTRTTRSPTARPRCSASTCGSTPTT